MLVLLLELTHFAVVVDTNRVETMGVAVPAHVA